MNRVLGLVCMITVPVLGAACAAVHECPRAEPRTDLLEPASAEAPAEAPPEPTLWLTLELLSQSAEPRPIELALLEAQGGRSGQVVSAWWLEPAFPGDDGGRRSAGAANPVWSDGRLIVDVRPVGYDVGKRLMLLRQADGSWVGYWDHTTIAGQVAGGRLRVVSEERAAREKVGTQP